MLKLLRITGLLEGISYLLLMGVAMPLKYAMDIKEPNWYIGMAHGFLFVAYVMLVLIVGFRKNWKYGVIFLALLASLLPFATFIADAKIFRRSDDPDLRRAV